MAVALDPRLLVVHLQGEIRDAKRMARVRGLLLRAEEPADGWTQKIVVQIVGILEARYVAYDDAHDHRAQTADRTIPEVAYLWKLSESWEFFLLLV